MKILVIQTAYPGDAILTLPMIQILKANNPFTRIDVLAIPATAEIFENSDPVNEVIIYDKKNRDKSLGSFIRLINKIRKKKYDKIISPHRSARSSLLSFFSGVSETVSFDKSTLSFLYKTRVSYRNEVHETRRNLDLIGFDASGGKWKVQPEITVTGVTNDKIRKIMKDSGITSPVAIAPGSVWNTKIYPLEYFEKVVGGLVKNNHQIVIIGGGNDEEAGRKLLKIDGDNVFNFAGKFNILESIALLRYCKLLISNDSAPTHMGMCAGIPVLTIYCSTVPQFGFYPYNNGSRFISYDDLDCKPCGIHGYKECPLSHFKCGYELFPTEVLNTASEMLGTDINR